jgi:hypothetical protein
MGIRETPAWRVHFCMFDRNSVGGGVTSVLSVRLFRAGKGKRPSQWAPALCGAGFQPQRGGAPVQHLTFWMRFLLRKRILVWRMRSSGENATICIHQEGFFDPEKASVKFFNNKFTITYFLLHIQVY